MRIGPLHLIGGVAALVAIYNVYSAVEREPVHALREDNQFLEKQMSDLQHRLEDAEREKKGLMNDLSAARHDVEEMKKRNRVASMRGNPNAVRAAYSGQASSGGGGLQVVASSVQNSQSSGQADDSSSNMQCHPDPKSEYWGDVVKWGDKHSQPTAGDCCQACKDFLPVNGKGCNVWVWCPNPSGCAGQKYMSCWLKYLPHPSIATTTANRAPEVTWTSGAIHPDSDSVKDTPDRSYHIIMTANAHRYVQWQSRVMYYWYMKQKAKNPHGSMGGFTRLLHAGRPDEYMDEIPTVVVKALDNDHGFVVLSRPYAFVQWARDYAHTIPEKYILMSEPDHLFMKPLPNLMIGEKPAAFPFFYIVPKKYPDLIRKFAGPIGNDEIERMDPIGNSPNFIAKSDLQRLAPVWMNVTMAIKLDSEANKAWGWVLEMWGYTIASKIVGLSHDLHPNLAAQPPWDTKIGNFYMIHFTYGCDYDLDGKFTPGKIGKWRFDKRQYMGGAPPRQLKPPPPGTPELTVKLISMLNEAMGSIPNWRGGA